MTHLWRDVQFGVRHLLKHPGSTAVVVLALAIGIGGNTAIFSVVHATLLEPLPYQDADRLVMVWSKPRPEFRNSTAPADYIDWRNQNTVFAGLHAWTGRTVSLLLSDRPEQIQGAVGTPGWISNHGLRLAHGRDFVPEEGVVGKDDVVILSHRLWAEKLGGDASVVGRPLRIDGRPHTVVGVLAKGPADRMESRLAGDRFSAILFGSFAGMALLLAALGIYGVMSFVVAQRRHELGVRFALGATRAHVLGLVLKDGLAIALLGTALGFVGAFWLGRAMQGMFEGTPGLDTARFALMAATLIATAALACFLPARRASRVDPLTALREE